MHNSSISIFFPAFNEEAAIGRSVSDALRFIPQISGDFEIIIVDDGSSDKTSEICNALAEENKNVRVIRHSKNLGYGAALKSGFAAASKELVFFTDGDNQFDITELRSFLPHLKDADLIIGYRIKRRDHWHRVLFGKMFGAFIGILFNVWAKDIDCAFKLIKKEVLKDLALKSDGALISAELLIKAKKKGFRIKEIGVHHFPRKGGRSTGGNIKVIAKAFFEIIKFYWELRQ